MNFFKRILNRLLFGEREVVNTESESTRISSVVKPKAGVDVTLSTNVTGGVIPLEILELQNKYGEVFPQEIFENWRYAHTFRALCIKAGLLVNKKMKQYSGDPEYCARLLEFKENVFQKSQQPLDEIIEAWGVPYSQEDLTEYFRWFYVHLIYDHDPKYGWLWKLPQRFGRGG